LVGIETRTLIYIVYLIFTFYLLGFIVQELIKISTVKTVNCHVSDLDSDVNRGHLTDWKTTFRTDWQDIYIRG